MQERNFTDIANGFLNKRMSRRGFLRGAGTTGLGLATAAVIGCDDGGEEEGATVTLGSTREPRAEASPTATAVPTQEATGTPTATKTPEPTKTPEAKVEPGIVVEGRVDLDEVRKKDVNFPKSDLLPGQAAWLIGFEGVSIIGERLTSVPENAFGLYINHEIFPNKAVVFVFPDDEGKADVGFRLPDGTLLETEIVDESFVKKPEPKESLAFAEHGIYAGEIEGGGELMFAILPNGNVFYGFNHTGVQCSDGGDSFGGRGFFIVGKYSENSFQNGSRGIAGSLVSEKTISGSVQKTGVTARENVTCEVDASFTAVLVGSGEEAFLGAFHRNVGFLDWDISDIEQRCGCEIS